MTTGTVKQPRKRAANKVTPKVRPREIPPPPPMPLQEKAPVSPGFINPRPPVTDQKVIKTYRASRAQKMGSQVRPIGDLVPEAATWLRVDSHVHTGYLNEVWVTEAVYAEAVQKYCPDLAPQLARLTGIDERLLNGEMENGMTDVDRNEDGSISDQAAMRALEKERERASLPANERLPEDMSAGTPGQLDADSADDMHSDGGGTLHSDEQGALVEELTEDSERKEPQPDPRFDGSRDKDKDETVYLGSDDEPVVVEEDDDKTVTGTFAVDDSSK